MWKKLELRLLFELSRSGIRVRYEDSRDVGIVDRAFLWFSAAICETPPIAYWSPSKKIIVLRGGKRDPEGLWNSAALNTRCHALLALIFFSEVEGPTPFAYEEALLKSAAVMSVLRGRFRWAKAPVVVKNVWPKIGRKPDFRRFQTIVEEVKDLRSRNGDIFPPLKR